MTVGCEKTCVLTPRGLFSRESESSSGLFRRPGATSTSASVRRSVSPKTEKAGRPRGLRQGTGRREDAWRHRTFLRLAFCVHHWAAWVTRSGRTSPVATLVVLVVARRVSGTCLGASGGGRQGATLLVDGEALPRGADVGQPDDPDESSDDYLTVHVSPCRRDPLACGDWHVPSAIPGSGHALCRVSLSRTLSPV